MPTPRTKGHDAAQPLGGDIVRPAPGGPVKRRCREEDEGAVQGGTANHASHVHVPIIVQVNHLMGREIQGGEGGREKADEAVPIHLCNRRLKHMLQGAFQAMPACL